MQFTMHPKQIILNNQKDTLLSMRVRVSQVLRKHFFGRKRRDKQNRYRQVFRNSYLAVDVSNSAFKFFILHHFRAFPFYQFLGERFFVWFFKLCITVFVRKVYNAFFYCKIYIG